MNVHARLADLGIALPPAAAPVASYQPLVVIGGIAHVSGQLPFAEGELITGRLGEDVSLERGVEAARACALMVLAQLAKADLLDKVEQVVKLGVFVNSAPGFIDQPKVANGASDLMFEVLGEAGRHARSAVGVSSLPLGAAVEVDALVALTQE
jgi:enamine deaminase RidA (YjgF/YER057c/UK114 family)